MNIVRFNKLNLANRQFVHFASTQHMKMVSILHYTDHELLFPSFLKSLYIFNTVTGTIRPFVVYDESMKKRLETGAMVVNRLRKI